MNSANAPGLGPFRTTELATARTAARWGPQIGYDLPPPEPLWLVRDNIGGGAAEMADLRGTSTLRGLDFLSIRLVVFCADRRCLSAAARECSISLSAASHRLTNLEKALNTRLFKRGHLGLQPTQAGAVFATHARAILLALHSAERRLTALSAAGV